MSILYYVAPVAIILVIIVVMMPIMKKKAASATQGMMVIQNLPVHLFMMAGGLRSINGRPAAEFTDVNGIYGIDTSGLLNIEFVPHFTHAETTYKGDGPMNVQFMAETGKSYQIKVEPKEPKDMTNILDVSPIVNQKLVFKTTFYVVTKDITDEKDAKGMRGIW